MSQEKTFQLPLKNDQTIELKFTPISATGDRLWQMFATTEALDALAQLIGQVDATETKSARKTAPAKSTVDKKKK
jgi:hypothetical protein